MAHLYTRKGDDGKTGILGEGRLPKHAPRIEVLGTMDEASAALGLARALSPSIETRDLLAGTQRDLYDIMAEVAASPENAARFRLLSMERVHWLESQVDALSAEVPAPKEFILPGDTTAGAALSLARTVVRRAERRMTELVEMGEVPGDVILPYLNRLSSLCFVLELQANRSAGQDTSLARQTDPDPK